ncbi:MAG: ankyrin repeat domain-containing protein [Luteolibacter sp.]
MKNLASEFRAALVSDLALAARLLVKHPSLIDQPVFGRSESALHFFATENRADVARWLLSKGANPNGTATGDSPLHAAAQLGHREVCQALIQAGANLDLQDNLGETALHKASSGGYVELIIALLDAGADPAIAEPCGELPVDQALPRKCEQITAVFNAHTNARIRRA